MTDLFFFNEGKKKAVFSISYGYDYKVIHLEQHLFNERFPLDSSQEKEDEKANNVQVACLTSRRFYIIQNNDLKVEAR